MCNYTLSVFIHLPQKKKKKKSQKTSLTTVVSPQRGKSVEESNQA
jgi:hypothetical protein